MKNQKALRIAFLEFCFKFLSLQTKLYRINPFFSMFCGFGDSSTFFLTCRILFFPITEVNPTG